MKKQKSPVFKPKPCAMCEMEFVPTTPTNKFCRPCKESPQRAIAIKEIARAASSAWAKNNKQKVRKAHVAWIKRNREKIHKTSATWRANNPHKVRAHWEKANRKKQCEADPVLRASNLEKNRVLAAAWRQENKEKCIAMVRASHQKSKKQKALAALAQIQELAQKHNVAPTKGE